MKRPIPKKKRFSLKTVFTIPFVIIIITTVGLTSYLGFLNGEGAVNVLASQLHREVTSSAEQRLDSYLNAAPLINQLNLDEISSGQLNVSDPNMLLQHFLAQMLRFDSVKSIAYANEQNDYLGPVRNILGDNLVLGVSNNGTNHRLEVYGIDSHGNRGAYLGGSAQEYDVRSRPWYQAAVQSSTETWTPIYIWTNSTDIGLDAVVPVYMKGKLAGVLDTSLTLNGISDFLQGLNATDHEQIMVVEPSGFLVASSSIKPYTTSGDQFNRLSAFDSNNTIIRTAVQTLGKQFGNLANIKSSDQFYFSAAGEGQLGQVLPYQNTYGLNWLIMVVTPESDYMAQINANNVNIVLIVTLSLVSGAVMVTTMTARRITEPLSRLNQSAKELANGDWTHKVEIDRHDEVGELASSFNNMAERLDASFSSLQASERRYRELFDLQPDTIIVSDFDGNILDANSAMERITGYSRGELLQMNLKRLTDPEGVARFPERIKTIANEGSASFDIKGIDKDGTNRDLETRGRLIEHEGKNAILFVTRDVTKRKRLEEELRRNSEHLEDVVDSKVRELKEINDRLVKSERMAAIGQMAAMLGHDIRNPLQSIIGATDNLEKRLDPSNAQTSKMVAIIKDSVDYSNQIISDLLDFSREMRLEPSESTPQLIVRETIAHVVFPENIKVSDLTEERPILILDRGKMRRALQHIIENAIQAMPGGGELTISSKRLDGKVEIVITDSGIGMAKEVLGKIFTPLFTTKAKGIGLGLAISRRIVEAHGGSVSVESKIGEGSSFTVKIPSETNRKETDTRD